MVFKISSFFFSLILAFHGLGQQLNFEELSQKVPLPASETYNILQDKKGYIWFATEAGYCRYAKNSLKVFGADAGLPEKAVYAATVAPDGVVWVATRDRRILFFKNDRFVEASFSKKYVSFTQNDWSFPHTMQFIGRYLYLQDVKRTRRIDLHTNEIVTLNHNVEPKVVSVAGNLLLLNHSTQVRSTKIYFENASFYGPVVLDEFTTAPAFVHKGNYIYIGGNSVVWQVNRKRKKVRKFVAADRVISILIDSRNNLWIGTQNHGLFKYQNSNLESTPFQGLSKLSISKIVEDHNGGIWCTTLERGVFYCQNPEVLSYSDVPDLSSRIDVLKNLPGLGVLAIRSGSQTIWRFDRLARGSVYSTIPLHSSYHSVQQYSGGLWVCGALRSILISRQRRSLDLMLDTADSHCYGMAERENEYYLFKYDRIAVLTHSLKYSVAVQFAAGRTRSIFQFSKDKVLIYGKELLAVYDLEKKTFSPLSPPSADITSATRLDSQRLLLGSKSQGLFSMDIASGLCLPVTRNFPNSTILTLEEDGRNIWIGTNSGVFVSDSTLRKFQNFSLQHNLPQTETRQIASHRYYTFFGTNDGLYSVHRPLYQHRFSIYPPVLKVEVKIRALTSPLTAFFMKTVLKAIITLVARKTSNLNAFLADEKYCPISLPETINFSGMCAPLPTGENPE